MATVDEARSAQAGASAWHYDLDDLPEVDLSDRKPGKSAQLHADRVQQGRDEAAAAREAQIDRQVDRRRADRARRRRMEGVSTAEIMAGRYFDRSAGGRPGPGGRPGTEVPDQ